MDKEYYENIYKTLNEKLLTKPKFYNIEDYKDETKPSEYIDEFYNEYKTEWINKHSKYKEYIGKDIYEIYDILINEKTRIKDIKEFAKRLLINFNHDEQAYLIKNPYGEYNERAQYLYEKMNNLTLDEYYETYKDDWRDKHNVERKDYRKYKSLMPDILNYPFKSKRNDYINDVIKDNLNNIPDYRINKKLMKPTYATHPYSYEIDIMFVQHPQFQKRYLKHYLVCVNVNTRYLFMFPIKDRSEKSIISALKQLLEKTKVSYIKCDGEKGFNSKSTNEFFKRNNIKTFISDSKFTYKLKIVDRVIRTIRDAMGLDPYWLANEKLMNQLVDYYNNTKHMSLKLRDPTFNKKWNYYTPAEMMNNIDLEWAYIRKMDRKYLKVCEEINKCCDYEPGNVLLIHLNLSKTPAKHEKQRRKFSNLAIFKEFRNGNAIVDLLRPYKFMKEYIEIPLMHTRYLCENVDAIPDKYIKYFLLNS